jgi:ABC-type branched-subunit amino acid transport system substrate-binding protein
VSVRTAVNLRRIDAMLLRTFLAPTSFLAAMIWKIWAQAAEPITVLASFNLTGPQAVLGAPCYKGAELAVEKLNAEAGCWAAPSN